MPGEEPQTQLTLKVSIHPHFSHGFKARQRVTAGRGRRVQS